MDTTLPLPQAIARLDRGRRAEYRANLDFYNGLQWSGRARPRERRITFNYARVFVDKVTSYLMSDLNFAVDPLSDEPAARERARWAEEALYHVYEQNNLAVVDFDTEIDCAVLGDAAYKVIWAPVERRVRVSAPDVQGLTAWWWPDDLSRVWRVASQYTVDAEQARLLYDVAARNRARTVTITEVWTDRTFELWADDAVLQSGPNPYGVIPFVIYPNIRRPKEFWGVSDVPAIKEAAGELNRALSALSMILELSGNPIAVLENVEQAEDIAVAPGAVWELPEKARAYLLDLLAGGGVKLHADYIDLLYRTLHDLAETPRTAFGDNQRALSGVALEMELHPLLQKVKRKRLIRADAYRRRSNLILRILEQFTNPVFDGESGRVQDTSTSILSSTRSRVVWGSLLPQDHSRLIDNEVKLIQAGVHSRHRAADELGVEDPDRELATWLAEEAAVRRVIRETF